MSLYTITIPEDDSLCFWAHDAEPDSDPAHWHIEYLGPCVVVVADDERWTLRDITDLDYYNPPPWDWAFTADGAIRWDDVPEGWLTHGAL